MFLRDLIQQPIVAVDTTEALLTLVFSNGERLQIHGEVGPYETAVIQPSDAALKPVVF